jgi:NAD dependent epimerase/dehydratase family enzyme
LGTGQQWFTWVHLEDLVNLYVLAIENADLSGPVNAVAPNVPRERDVAREIGHALHRPSWAPAPEFALRLVLGQMADLLLHGRRAVPAKAQAARFQFRYPEIGPALQEALR